MPKTQYLWDMENDSYLAELDGAGNVTAKFTCSPEHFGRVVSERRDGHTYHHHYDALGSTRALTDESGSVTDTFDYDAWGNEIDRTGATETPFRWVGVWGYLIASESTSYYVRRRIFCPAVCRWTAPDPIGTFLDPVLTKYSNNSPVEHVDPSGELCLADDCPTSLTQLGGILPTGGAAVGVGIEITTQRGPEMGPCGAFKWEIVWSVKGTKDIPPKGAFILQKVVINRRAWSCDGVDVSAKAFNHGGNTEYWEAFELSQRQRRSADRFASAPKKCTYGFIHVKGLYGLVRDNVTRYPLLAEGNVDLAPDTPASWRDPKAPFSPNPPRQHAIYVTWDCCKKTT